MSEDYQAFVSVRDTTELLELAGHLTKAGCDLVCPIKIASFLGQSGIEVTQLVSDVDASQFDLVICDLLDFQLLASQGRLTDQEVAEAMDLEHQSIILAAASHYHKTAIVCDRRDYSEIILHLQDLGEIASDFRRRLASKAFKNVAFHNFVISAYISLTGASQKVSQQQTLPF